MHTLEKYVHTVYVSGISDVDQHCVVVCHRRAGLAIDWSRVQLPVGLNFMFVLYVVYVDPDRETGMLGHARGRYIQQQDALFYRITSISC